MIRSLLRNFSRNRILRKQLPADLGGGIVCCSPEALLSMWKPGWRSHQAQGLLHRVRRYVRPGIRVWGLGANQGRLIVETAPENAQAKAHRLADSDYLLFDSEGDLRSDLRLPALNTLAWPSPRLADLERLRATGSA